MTAWWDRPAGALQASGNVVRRFDGEKWNFVGGVPTSQRGDITGASPGTTIYNPTTGQLETYVDGEWIVSGTTNPLTISVPSLSLTRWHPITGTVFSATGGSSGDLEWSLSGTVPSGVTIDDVTGELEGTPSVAGPYSFNVVVTDGVQTATAVVSGTIAAPTSITISPAEPLSLTQGASFSQAFSALGTNSDCAWSIIGSLPAGLDLDEETSFITGIPTGTGAYSFTLSVTDGTLTGSHVFSGNIEAAPPLAISSPLTLTGLQVGVPFQQVITAVGGVQPYTWTPPTLPAGLTWNPTLHRIEGSPTSAGSYSFAIHVADSLGTPIAKPYSGTIAASTALAISTYLLGNMFVGTPVSVTITKINAVGSTLFAVTAGTLPDGLNLNTSTGAITGTPTTAGPYSVTITATDSKSPTPQTAPYTYTGEVYASSTISYSPSSGALTAITSTSLYTSQDFTIAGGVPPYHVAFSQLPLGLWIDRSTVNVDRKFRVKGYPLEWGNGLPVAFIAEDSNSPIGFVVRSHTIDISPSAVGFAVAQSSSMPTTVGEFAWIKLIPSAGSGPYTYSVTSGALPAGLELTGDVISGYLTDGGPYAFEITGQDAGTRRGVISMSGTITAGALDVVPNVLPGMTAGIPYSAKVYAVGGTGSRTLALSGTLPSGLGFNAGTGVISGTPTIAAPYSFTITATDSASPTPASSPQTYTGTIAAQKDEDMPLKAPDVFYADGTWTKPTTGAAAAATMAKIEICNSGKTFDGGDAAEYWVEFSSLGSTVAVTVGGATAGATSSFGTRTTANAVANGATFYPGEPAKMYYTGSGINRFCHGGRGGGPNGGGGGTGGPTSVGATSGVRPGGGGSFNADGSTAGGPGAGMVRVTLY